jgi:hypothetical protein
MNKISTNLKSFSSLVKIIQEEILKGKQRALSVLENEKTITYWNIGKYINQHILFYKDRADYGSYVFRNLSAELDIGIRTLYRAVQFHEMYPEIVSPGTQLTWSHFRLLLTIKQEAKRNEYEKLIIQNKLSKREFKELLDKDKLIENQLIPDKKRNLKIVRGTPYIYKLKSLGKNANLYIDCGFNIYINKLNKKEYKEKDIIHVKKINEIYKYSIVNNASESIYTYKVYIDKIIDGDTLWVNINLGFDIITRQKIRLKSINAPDIKTKAGIKAKDYISSKLSSCNFIVIKTYWRDKFSRYLADIFYIKESSDILDISANGNFLNQELLDNNLVIKY